MVSVVAPSPHPVCMIPVGRTDKAYLKKGYKFFSLKRTSLIVVPF
jgi:hypothetical protein